MPSTEVVAPDTLRLDVSKQSLTPSYVKVAPAKSSGSSTSRSSDESFQSDSIPGDDTADVASLTPSTLESDDLPPPPCSVDNQQQVKSSSSFDLQDLTMSHLRDSTFRDSLMPRNGYGESNGAAGRATEMGNALMRLDEGYRQAYQSTSRLSSSSTCEGLTPLLQAAKAGDIVLVNALVIQAGTDILRRDPVFGQTALHFGIRGGHLNVVQALLMPQLRDSIVNVADTRRNTALHLAAAKSRRMTNLLLESGAEVNFLNMRNQTALGVHILTVTRDDPTMTEILLQHGANANAPVDKSTILHVALDKGLTRIATRLMRHNARLDLKDEAGKTVFDKVDRSMLETLMAKVGHPPVWVPDNDRVECMECRKKFGSLALRRHHCRMCGRVLCSSCSTCRVKKLPFSTSGRGKKKSKADKGTANARACKMCYDICAKGELESSSLNKEGCGSLSSTK
uniref:FYVE-type domain-containing protein n=1 Tax=Peronospora matthiolae TaxID=2874970 RepID=A0AAV1V930_9STRA